MIWMWLIPYYLVGILVALLGIRHKGAATLLDLFLIPVIAVIWPLGVFVLGEEITIWKKKS